jgi:hypothetical protein
MSKTYHPPLLGNPRIGFRFGQRYPNLPIFGSLQGQRHLGVDYLVPIGTPVYAIDNGTLKYSTGKHGGITVNLVTDDGLSVRYMHLSRYENRAKTRAVKGEIIAYSGNTGVSNSGGHLHVDVYNGRITIPTKFANFIDPLSLNYQIKEEDMETKELRAIVEGIYWSFGMRQPDKQGVDFWLSEYNREAEKSKWLARILEGLRGEKIAQKPEALRYLDARENRWRSEKDVLGK